MRARGWAGGGRGGAAGDCGGGGPRTRWPTSVVLGSLTGASGGQRTLILPGPVSMLHEVQRREWRHKPRQQRAAQRERLQQTLRIDWPAPPLPFLSFRLFGKDFARASKNHYSAGAGAASARSNMRACDNSHLRAHYRRIRRLGLPRLHRLANSAIEKHSEKNPTHSRTVLTACAWDFFIDEPM